jgi:hypothetical protein
VRNLTVWACTLILMLPTLLMPSGVCVCQLLRQVESRPSQEVVSAEESKPCCSRCAASSFEHTKKHPQPHPSNRSVETSEKSAPTPSLPPCCELAATHHLAHFTDADLVSLADLHRCDTLQIAEFVSTDNDSRILIASPPFLIAPHHVCRVLLI